MISMQVNENLEMRMLKKKDVPEVYSLVDENREYLRQWLPWLDTAIDHSNSEEFIKLCQKQHDDNLGFNGGMFYNSKLVGMIGYHPINTENNSAVIGYWLSESEQGKGLVTICVRYIINFAFQEMKLNKITIPAAEENHRSRGVSERLGLVLEGIERDAENLYGNYVNHARYSILRSEWEQNLLR